MRKTYTFLSVSLDGFFEGPGHDISWHNVDDDFNKYAIEQLRATDLMLYGRRTYQLMEASWPRFADDPATSEDNLEIARLINNTPKVVYSRSLDHVEERRNWRNVRLVREFDPAEVRGLKGKAGGEIAVGGPDLASSLLKERLIDEIRLMVTPIILGRGTPVFAKVEQRLKLELLGSTRFDSGNVLLRYRPIG